MKNYGYVYTFIIMTIFIIANLTGGVNTKSVPYIGNPVVENCVACKFIWENIEEALGGGGSFLDSQNTRNPILAAQAFQYFCRIAPDIFFEPCNVMFEKLFFMTQDFCAKKSVLNLCIDNELCSK
jgi:hypothetical protein